MPDDWEIANGLNPLINDANGDADHDGATNLEEYLAGTNPQDASDYLRITQIIKPTPGQTQITWTSVAGKTYRIQYSTILVDPWLPIGSDVPATTTGTLTQLLFTGIATDRLFLRVRVLP